MFGQLGLDESQFWFLPFLFALRGGRYRGLSFSLRGPVFSFHFRLPFLVKLGEIGALH